MEQSQETKDQKLLDIHVGENEKNGDFSSNNLGNGVTSVKTSDIIENTEGISKGEEIAKESLNPDVKNGLSIATTVSVSEVQSKTPIPVTEQLQESHICVSPSQLDTSDGMVVGDLSDSSQCGYAIGDELNCNKEDVDGSVEKGTLRKKSSDEFQLDEPIERCEEPDKNIDAIQSALSKEDDMPTENILDDVKKALNENENCPEDYVDSCAKSVVSESEQLEQSERESRCELSAAHTVLNANDSEECVDSSVASTSRLDTVNSEDGVDLSDANALLDEGDSEDVEIPAPHSVLVTGDSEEYTSATATVLDTGDSEEMETSASPTVLITGDAEDEMSSKVFDTGDSEEMEIPASHTVLITGDEEEEMSGKVFDKGDSEEKETSAKHTLLITSDADEEMSDNVFDTGNSEEMEISASHTVLITDDAEEMSRKGFDTGDSEEMETSATHTVSKTCNSEVSMERTVLDTEELTEIADEIGSPCEQAHDNKHESSETNNENKERDLEDILISDSSLEATVSVSKSNLESTEEGLASEASEVPIDTKLESGDKNVCVSVHVETESDVQSEVGNKDSEIVECGTNNENNSKGQSEAEDDSQKEYSDSEKETIKTVFHASNSVEEVTEDNVVSPINESELLVEDVSVDSQDISSKMDITNSDSNEKEIMGRDTDSDVINKEEEEKLLSEDTETQNVEDNSVIESHEHPNIESEKDVDDGNGEGNMATDNEGSDSGVGESGLQDDLENINKNKEGIEKVIEEEEEIKELEKDKGKPCDELELEKDKNENTDALEVEKSEGENSRALELENDKGECADEIELEEDKRENCDELEPEKDKGENSDELQLEKDKGATADELELEKDENSDELMLEKDKDEHFGEIELEKDIVENSNELELEKDKGENSDELELEKDKGEHFDELDSENDKEEQFEDMQENVEFVQIDSDKDESSQQSLDKAVDENIKSADEDPIAVSTDENKVDTAVEQEYSEEAMEVDDAVDLDSSTGSRITETVDEPESVDISLMCETVLEESSATVTKPLDSGDDVVDIVEIIETDLGKENERQKESSKRKGIGTKVIVRNKNADSASRKQANTNDLDDEEICIIPDTVPRVLPGGKESKGKPEQIKGKKITKQIDATEKAKEKSPEVQKDATETRRTPGRPQRQAAKRAESQIKEIADEERQETEEHISGIRMCDGCFKLRSWVTSLKLQENGTEKVKYFCSQDCLSNFKRLSRTKSSDSDSNAESVKRIARKCAQCSSLVTGDEKNLSWETMDYCNEECLGRYQKILGSQCANCRGIVASPSLGKYCVRFGYDVKQFCCSTCLEEFKKGLKVCSYCQKDISGGAEGFLAPVGDKGQFKDFCTQSCMEKYDQMSNNQAPPVVVQVCAVCNNEKPVSMEVMHKKRVNKFCSEPCFAAFRFVNGMIAEQCYMCKKYFDKKEVDNFAVYSDDLVHCFCSKTCMNVYILANRKIVPCHWCKVKKYNFDMIKRIYNTGQLLLVCSLNCLSLYQYGANSVSTKRVKCDMCGVTNALQYNLNMSDNSVRNFCSYVCVMKFQEQFASAMQVDSSPFPTGGPKRYMGSRRSLAAQQNESQRENVSGSKTNSSANLPVISSVQSLANDDSSTQTNAGITTRSGAALKQVNNNVSQNAAQPQKVVRQIIVRPPIPKPMRNKAVTCRPSTHTKGTHCRPIVNTKETQTESSTQSQPILIPVPVPIYVPAPMCMYSSAFPVPVPFPLPVPVPVFIPTTRNSMKGIMKEIKRIQDKIPVDPFEAEILMMAEIVAGQKKEANSDSDSDVDNVDAGSGNGADEEEEGRGTTTTEGRYSPETVDTSNTFGEDMLQMALKMATELEEPTDLEAALTPTTITTQPASSVEQTNSESEDDPEPVQPAQEARPQRGRKRPSRAQRNSSTPTTAGSSANKRRRVSTTAEPLLLPPPEPSQATPVVEQEKPDANMCLKYTLGVNAWKRWVLTKNAELEKAAANNRKLKLFKTEILQQTADELNYSLCLFVKEVRKPNGQEYAPDTIYYLCLGIQQYLFESGRIDNIFTDPYYEKFTECLDEVAKKFSTLYNDSQYIVTRVEEEHLWESKQLGAHSPHVLLSTLMFFNTKHFNLTTVDEHMQLSFSHIMKHWKRNPNQSGSSKSTGGSRNVLLRFYPPQSALESNSKKKKVYEQQENEENPLRCPVKLYEFYLSKCPESVKTRNDVFYLLPERSCVPDSPVWYSTMALGKEPLMKMLHRVKMVKEINQALLKS